MKFSNLILSTLVLSALQAQAQYVAIDPIPVMPIAKVVLGGGMPVPGGMATESVTIQNDGSVILETIRYAEGGFKFEAPQYRLLVEIPAAELTKLEREISALRGGAFTQGSGTVCEDAPGYEYDVVREGQDIPVFRNQGCMDMPLKDHAQRPAALILKKYLDALLGLATYPGSPVVQLTFGGGMPGPGILVKEVITVLNDGSVKVEKTSYSADGTQIEAPVTSALPALSAETVAKISYDVMTLKGGAFSTNKGISCEDAPNYTYSIFKNGNEVPVFKIDSCVEIPLADHHQRAAALDVKSLLDGLKQLAL